MSELRKKVERLKVYVEVELEAPVKVGEKLDDYDRGYEAAFKDIISKLDHVLKE